ncbi:MAG TPA: choice-of-anchor tandem repeat GloVer-containing protein [Syntrophobacteraceae bacterium]|nr:choice-of-anchor tandem repeat GloVer-containing protein [Syntrophobacteraceae bacterium]
MRKNRILLRFAVLALAVSLVYWSGPIGSFASEQTGASDTFQVLHSFDGTDGANPWRSLILYGGNLYGMTFSGGHYGYGTIFEFNTETGKLTTLLSFDGKDDGQNPYGSLILSGENLYGMTSAGGHLGWGGGTIFEFDTEAGQFTTSYVFYYQDYISSCGCYDNWYKGATPWGTLMLSGTNLYGTTTYGGAIWNDENPNGYGTIFEFNIETGQLTTLHSFDGTDGSSPQGNLILYGGNLYGTTYYGGTNDNGTILEFNTKTGKLTTLHRFDGTDGACPHGGLTLYGENLYGTTVEGGAYRSKYWGNGFGTIFELNAKTGKFETVHNFAGYPKDGAQPWDNLMLSGENLYGTTALGGANSTGDYPNGCGTIFQFNAKTGKLTTLHSFDETHGSEPHGSLILSGENLYGMTYSGGASGAGVIFSCPLKINGACGSANGESFLKAPTSDLCEAGEASAVTGKGPWKWTCEGINGGTTEKCSAKLK